MLFTRTKSTDHAPIYSHIQSVAIIGAGASGLIAAKTMTDAGFEVKVFERKAMLGGVWNFDLETPMYDSLRTNLPKEIMGFNHHFPLEDTSERSFLAHREILSYLERFAISNNLHQYVQFNTNVIRISKSQSGKWEVTTTDSTTTAEPQSSCYDALMICNGHFDIPYYSSIPGLSDYYRGEVKHARDYEGFKADCRGKRILIIGTKSSGTDIARELSSIELDNTIFVSDRSVYYEATKRTEYQVASNISILPAVHSITATGDIRFTNNDALSQIDMILFCTGYQYHYPFLSQELNNEVEEVVHVASRGRRVCPLYQQLFAVHDPTLTFLGLPFSIVPFPMFYLQVAWIVSVYTGQTTLPSHAKQVEWLATFEEELRTQGWYEDKYHYMGGKRQWEYDKMIIDVAELHKQDPDIVSYLHVIEAIYEDVVKHRPVYTGAADTYRNRRYHIDRESWTWTVEE